MVKSKVQNSVREICISRTAASNKNLKRVKQLRPLGWFVNYSCLHFLEQLTCSNAKIRRNF